MEVNPTAKRRAKEKIPKLLSKEALKEVESKYPHATTWRERVDLAFSLRAYNILKEDADCEWLVDQVEIKEGIPQFKRPYVFAQLGRTESPNVMRAATAQICKYKLPPLETFTLAQRCKWGAMNEDGLITFELIAILFDTIVDYLIANPLATYRHAYTAIDTVGYNVGRIEKTLNEGAKYYPTISGSPKNEQYTK